MPEGNQGLSDHKAQNDQNLLVSFIIPLIHGPLFALHWKTWVKAQLVPLFSGVSQAGFFIALRLRKEEILIMPSPLGCCEISVRNVLEKHHAEVVLSAFAFIWTIHLRHWEVMLTAQSCAWLTHALHWVHQAQTAVIIHNNVFTRPCNRCEGNQVPSLMAVVGYT